jgi:nitrite reductase (NADH) small subunit
LFALSNFDPFSQAFVMSRGIIGDKNGVLKVASPIYKQNFSLETGACLDDDSVRLSVYAVCTENGRVLVAIDPAPKQGGPK